MNARILNIGSLELETDQVDRNELLTTLPPKDRKYITRMNDDIAALEITAASLAAEEKAITARMKRSPDGQRLATIRVKRRLIEALKAEKTQRAEGVWESALEKFMPGACLGEKIMALVEHLNSPSPTPRKQLKAQ